jgi:hypothetical protein
VLKLTEFCLQELEKLHPVGSYLSIINNGELELITPLNKEKTLTGFEHK